MSDGGTFAQWVTIAGTLGGATLGFAASFFTTWYSRRSESREQREERDRKRLEKIYELLVVLSQENGQKFMEAVNYIHYARRPLPSETEGIPPLVELEMLTSLYFKNLVPLKNNIVGATHEFSKEYVDALNTDYRSKDLKEKQKVSGELFNLSESLKKEIDQFKVAIAELVKS
ncbi:hypothetical protein SAMN04487880_1450 [Marinobacter sp. es.042]|uniref:hypothetical protein n=1 Tax=Marinobacter TaxID=2742 RepID=UPI000B50F86F|nr:MULTISPECIES: hypothetical protein [Marinobacter]MBW3225139.1 hypothetical protein [Marinobacter adhaerens]SNB56092.1 hypothetical protein SAMN04487880_1450 [Marinobacter sp. es.042]